MSPTEWMKIEVNIDEDEAAECMREKAACSRLKCYVCKDLKKIFCCAV